MLGVQQVFKKILTNIKKHPIKSGDFIDNSIPIEENTGFDF